MLDRLKRFVGQEIYSVPDSRAIGQKGPSNVGMVFSKDLTEQICKEKQITVEEFKKQYKGKVTLWLDFEDKQLYIITKIVPSDEAEKDA